MPYRIAPVISGRPNDPFADPDRLRYPPAVRKSAPELLRLMPKAHRVLVAVQTSRKTAFEASIALSAVDASKYQGKAAGSNPVSGSHQRLITEHPEIFSKKRKKCLHFGEKSDIIPLRLRNAQKLGGIAQLGEQVTSKATRNRNAASKKLISRKSSKIKGFRFHGGIAQLGERLNGIQEVSGSIPLISTNNRP